MITAILFILVLYAMWQALTSPGCSSCGKKLAHADDCWRKR